MSDYAQQLKSTLADYYADVSPEDFWNDVLTLSEDEEVEPRVAQKVESVDVGDVGVDAVEPEWQGRWPKPTAPRAPETADMGYEQLRAWGFSSSDPVATWWRSNKKRTEKRDKKTGLLPAPPAPGTPEYEAKFYELYWGEDPHGIAETKRDTLNTPVYDPSTGELRPWKEFKENPDLLKRPEGTPPEESAELEEYIGQVEAFIDEFKQPDMYARAPDSEADKLNLKEITGDDRDSKEKREQLKVDRPGLHNILEVLAKATPEEVDYYREWYGIGHIEAAKLAAKYNRPLDLVCGVIAVLSQQTDWLTNLYLADRALANDWKNVKNVYEARQKAYSLVVEGDFGAVSGPKIFPFFLSLLDPVEYQNEVVVDTHAFAIWTGIRTGSVSGIDPVRKQIVEDYTEAGRLYGLSPQSVQAITWMLWRQYPVISKRDKATGEVTEWGRAPVVEDIQNKEQWSKGKPWPRDEQPETLYPEMSLEDLRDEDEELLEKGETGAPTLVPEHVLYETSSEGGPDMRKARLEALVVRYGLMDRRTAARTTEAGLWDTLKQNVAPTVLSTAVGLGSFAYGMNQPQQPQYGPQVPHVDLTHLKPKAPAPASPFNVQPMSEEEVAQAWNAPEPEAERGWWDQAKDWAFGPEEQPAQPAQPAPQQAEAEAEPGLYGDLNTAAFGHTPHGTAQRLKGYQEYKDVIAEAAAKNGIPANMLATIANTESGFDPSAVGPPLSKGRGNAKGMFQFIDSTAADLGVSNPHDPVEAADGSARYLKQLLNQFGGNVELAIRAYNAGPGNVQKWFIPTSSTSGEFEFGNGFSGKKQNDEYWERYKEVSGYSGPGAAEYAAGGMDQSGERVAWRRCVADVEGGSEARTVRAVGPEREQYADAVWDMYYASYATIGHQYDNVGELLAENTDWEVTFDEDGAPKVFTVLKRTPYGYKRVLSGTDGTREGKTLFKAALEGYKRPGFYGEVSHRMEQLAERYDLPSVLAAKAGEILQKDIEPDPENEYRYTRQITGLPEPIRKRLIGVPMRGAEPWNETGETSRLLNASARERSSRRNRSTRAAGHPRTAPTGTTTRSRSSSTTTSTTWTTSTSSPADVRLAATPVPDAKPYSDLPKKEPSRKKKELPVEEDGGVENIIAVAQEATPEERDYWSKWYDGASSTAAEMAARYKLPHETVAGVLAVMSPGSLWRTNVGQAKRLIEWWQDQRRAGPFSDKRLMGPGLRPAIPGIREGQKAPKPKKRPKWMDERPAPRPYLPSEHDEEMDEHVHVAPTDQPKKKQKKPWEFPKSMFDIELDPDESADVPPRVKEESPLGMFGPPVAGYPDSVKKAIDILETNDPTAYVTGPKVTVFFESLVDPEKMREHLTLDGHAINIWRGEKKPLKGLKQPTARERPAMEADYAKAAAELGMSVQGLQALTWYIWKMTQPVQKGADSEVDVTDKVAWYKRAAGEFDMGLDADELFGEGASDIPEDEEAVAPAPELVQGDVFTVGRYGPTWSVVKAHGASGYCQRQGHKHKWFGYEHNRDTGNIAVYPVKQGSGDRIGDPVAFGPLTIIGEKTGSRRRAYKSSPLGQRELENWLDKGDTAAFFSGARPGSRSHKKKLNLDLLKVLRTMDVPAANVRSLHGSWEESPGKVASEPSVAVRGLSLAQVLELATKFNQDAFVFKDETGVVGMYQDYLPRNAAEGKTPSVRIPTEDGVPLLGSEALNVAERQKGESPLVSKTRGSSFEFKYDWDDDGAVFDWPDKGTPLTRDMVLSTYVPSTPNAPATSSAEEPLGASPPGADEPSSEWDELAVEFDEAADDDELPEEEGDPTRSARRRGRHRLAQLVGRTEQLPPAQPVGQLTIEVVQRSPSGDETAFEALADGQLQNVSEYVRAYGINQADADPQGVIGRGPNLMELRVRGVDGPLDEQTKAQVLSMIGQAGMAQAAFQRAAVRLLKRAVNFSEADYGVKYIAESPLSLAAYGGGLTLPAGTTVTIEGVHPAEQDPFFGVEGLGEVVPGGTQLDNLRIRLVLDNGEMLFATPDEIAPLALAETGREWEYDDTDFEAVPMGDLEVEDTVSDTSSYADTYVPQMYQKPKVHPVLEQMETWVNRPMPGSEPARVAPPRNTGNDTWGRPFAGRLELVTAHGRDVEWDGRTDEAGLARIAHQHGLIVSKAKVDGEWLIVPSRAVVTPDGSYRHVLYARVGASVARVAARMAGAGQ